MIKKNKIRKTITIDKELYKKTEEKAKNENRSFSNYVINLIKKDE